MHLTQDPMEVFAPVRPLDVRSLAGPALDVQVPSGSVLIHEGRLVGTFFVIRSGTAELWQGDRRVGTLTTGDCFGEIDPTELEPQRYSVIATSPMRLLTFSAYGIGRLCSALPSVRDRLLAYLPSDPASMRAQPTRLMAALSLPA
ncbi:MAG TPA: cyclic nucleotide-binding domain-containing protein [Solirubrobacteraceae bacterium]|nr:cyclic nucleotide-binding domain-containing protein [Solirubrobacteraceae bacterium]